MKSVEIAGRRISADAPPFVIAEISGNHNGEIERALQLIDVAADAGAHAVKLQTYTADTITIDHDGPGFRIEGGLWDGRTLHDLYNEAHTPWDWHAPLFAYGRERGLIVLSSPFDARAVDLLEDLDAPAYKIASFEIVDLPLITHTAATGKPLIISTGMSSLDEITEAVAAAREGGDGGVVLLHCISGYPTPAAEANLRRIGRLAQTFDCPIGLSDHTLGTDVAVAAVAMGATVIEKHITLARADGGPDAEFSLEPNELTRLVDSVKTAHVALGSPEHARTSSEIGNAAFRRSLYVVADIAAGDIITDSHVRSIRPGHGLAPKHLPTVLGARAIRAATRGTPMTWDLIEGEQPDDEADNK